MSAIRHPLPSLHNLFILCAAILVVCSKAVTATSSTVDYQSKGHFKNSTTPNIPDRNEERTLWRCVEGLVELLNNFDNFLMGTYPSKASMVDTYLKNTGLQFRARNSFMSQEFKKAVDKILVLHSGDHKLAQEAIFEGLKRATRAGDRTEMSFELGRTIGSYKLVDTTSTPSSPTIARAEIFEGHVERDEAQEKQMRFVLGLEPHLLKYWVKREFTSGHVWKGLKLDVRKSGIFKSPIFRVYIDYITRLEPNELVRYDKVLKDVRRWSIVYSLEPIPDLVIAQQLVHAGAPNNADVATTHVMEALFRDWKFNKLSHYLLFQHLLPYFTFELESLLQGPLKLWIAYFGGTENPASYKMLLDTIIKSAESGTLRDAPTELVSSRNLEDRLIKMNIGLMRHGPQFPDTAVGDFAHSSKLFIQAVLEYMERDHVTANYMLNILEIRDLKHKELLEDPRLWTWMSFVIESYGDIKNFESADPEGLRNSAPVKRDIETVFDHLNKQLNDDELLTLIRKAIGWDQRFRHLFASNLAKMFKTTGETSHSTRTSPVVTYPSTTRA